MSKPNELGFRVLVHLAKRCMYNCCLHRQSLLLKSIYGVYVACEILPDYMSDQVMICNFVALR